MVTLRERMSEPCCRIITGLLTGGELLIRTRRTNGGRRFDAGLPRQILCGIHGACQPLDAMAWRNPGSLATMCLAGDNNRPYGSTHSLRKNLGCPPGTRSSRPAFADLH